ncbi:group XV phospholipase a2 [Plakobranchus ocellatus]|uniref:Group XV phospholipase a2 n=1 Tax=Plakobranchus ocellatus TaxID=259542 RepID=A0AAV4B2D1_9GAST|nr:group XV phospholipase a2 [Plakobranchus ocellatus]
MKTKLALRMDLDVSDLFTESGHVCEKCVVHWTHEMCEMVEELPNMEHSVKDDVKYSLVYIAGYVIRKDKEEVEDSCSYFEKFGAFTLSLSRGGLFQAGDSVCQWTIFCYMMFQSVWEKVCRNSLNEIFIEISQNYGFKMDKHHCFALSNILFNNLCNITNLPSDKEPKQKVLKLP